MSLISNIEMDSFNGAYWDNINLQDNIIYVDINGGQYFMSFILNEVDDINQDGNVDVLDVTHAAQNGVPEVIVQDIVANIGTAVPAPVIPEPPPPPIEPGPWLTQNNLWLPPNNYGLFPLRTALA